MAIARMQAVRAEPMRGVLESSEFSVAVQQLVSLLRFFSFPNVLEEKNVTIHVAEKSVTGKFLGLIVDAGEVFRAVSFSAHFGHVPNAEIAAGFIPKQQDFELQVDLLPTPQRIALDHGNVTLEGLWSGEKSQHEHSVRISAINFIGNLQYIPRRRTRLRYFFLKNERRRRPGLRRQ